MTVDVLDLVSTAFAADEARGSGRTSAVRTYARSVERERVDVVTPRSLDEALRLRPRQPGAVPNPAGPTSWWP
jgi:hypothetical protein